MNEWSEYLFDVHWLSVTYHCDLATFERVIWPGVSSIFGDLIDAPVGGKGYRDRKEALSGVKVYYNPINSEECHVHLEIPGSGCECMTLDKYKLLVRSDFGFLCKATRIDLAFDMVEFSPWNVLDAVVQGKVVSLAKRDTLRFYDAPYQKLDSGDVGAQTCYFGSRSSERMIRVYNERGFNRIEMQCRGDRALMVAWDLVLAPVSEMWKVAMGHLRQFVEFDTPWWQRFVEGTVRYSKKIESARRLSVQRLDGWLKRQVGLALYTLQEVSGQLYVDELLQDAQQKYKTRKARGYTHRYDVLLQLA